jgi:Zn-dependent protease
MNIAGIVVLLIILLFSSILHEVMHGFVADRLGDPTARLMGRLTLDPRKHLDLYMSILLPLLLLLGGSPIIFGAAKPVPIDPFNLKEGRKDVALVALCGPLTNLVIAVVANLFIRAGIQTGFLSYLLYQVVTLNLLLALFNLIPIPPLDGSKVLALLLPEKTASEYLRIERFGMIILFFLLLFPIGGFSLSQALFHSIQILQNVLLP